MNTFVTHCPIAATPFSTVLEQIRNNIFVIKDRDHNALKALKCIGDGARKAVLAIALCITALISPILLVADGFIHLGRKMGYKLKCTHFNDFHYLYTSQIFTSSINQLKKHVQNTSQDVSRETLVHPYHRKVVDFIDFIQKVQATQNEKSNRHLHHQVVDKIRVLSNEKPSRTEAPQLLKAIEFTEKLCEFVYVGMQLNSEMSEFLEKYIPEEAFVELNKIPSTAVPGWLKKWRSIFGSVAKFNGILEFPRLYDPRRLGDVPSIIYDHSISNKKIKVIRTPAVVRDFNRNAKGEVDKAEVVGEFRGFLESYKNQGKVHLYINLMERLGGSEATRSKLIEKLEQDYPNTLRVVTLAKDSDFYYQRKAFARPIQEYTSFKNQFLAELFNTQISTFNWSPTLLNAWQNICTKAIDQVQAKHFQSKSSLKINERRDFIELVYSEIVERAMEFLEPDSCNISCKSCIDRGPAFIAQQYLKNCMSINKDLNSAQRKQMAAIVLAPALFAQNRIMQAIRMDRLHTAAQRILSN